MRLPFPPSLHQQRSNAMADQHIEILKKALEALKARGTTYGNGIEENFSRAASIASLWMTKPVTARDVAMILASVKMSRIAMSPGHEDSFVDLCNYVAFAASFSKQDPVRSP